jgi:hypothetical protein
MSRTMMQLIFSGFFATVGGNGTHDHTETRRQKVRG